LGRSSASTGLHELAAARAPEASPELIAAIAEAMDTHGPDPRLCGEVYELERARDRTRRRADGVYYTPPHVVDLVIERSLGEALAGRNAAEALELRVIDPSCGGSVFLLAALERIAEHIAALQGGPVDAALRAEIARRCLRGIDIDPVAAAVSRLALSLACGGADLSECIAVGDSLLDDHVIEAGAFDAVIGNPPWGQKGFRFADGDKQRLRGSYATATGVLDPFKLFVELAHRLARSGARWALVLPDIILLKNQQPVRDLVLEKTTLEWIVDLGRAFPAVNLDAVIIAGRLAAAPAAHELRIWRRLPSDWRTDPPATHRLAQQVFRELPGHRFNIHLDDDALARIRALRSLPRLGDRFEVHEGVHSGNARAKLFRPERPEGAAARLIVGRKEIARYRLDWAGAWLDLEPGAIDRAAGDYANLGRPEWHGPDKLLVRRTGDRIIAAHDAEGYYASNNMFVVIPLTSMDGDELGAYTALLNSAFMTWYFRTVQPRTGRLFAELKIEHLVDFPVPEQTSWAAAVPRLAGLCRQLEREDDDEARAQVDGLVDELYGIGRTPPL
jgi:hypothetical protein